MMNDNQALRAAGVLLALDGQHLLHQAQAVGLVGVERIAGEQPAHGVAPAGDLVHTQGGAAEGEDAALHFHLGEAGVAGAQVDVRGENQFDADGVAIALRRDYHRFARPWAAKHPPRVAAAGRDLPARGKACGDIGQVQSGAEVLAMGVDQRHTGLAVALELTIG